MADVNTLVTSATDGDIDEVRRLVEVEHIDPNDASSSGEWTPLAAACFSGCNDIVRYLLQDANVDVEKAVGMHEWRPIYWAICGNNLTTVQILVEVGGANVDAINDRFCGMTPLHLSCLFGTFAIVRYLVEQGQADIYRKNQKGLIALAYAISQGDADSSRYLLPRMASVDATTLQEAWKKRDCPWDIRERVLEKFALGLGLTDKFRTNPIHTLFQFPLPSKDAFVESIEHFSCRTTTTTTTLATLDERGRLPLHVCLVASNPAVKHPSVVLWLANREPRSIIARDPTTGLYPHETVAMMSSITITEDAPNDTIEETNGSWLDVVYVLFKSNPEELLRPRCIVDGSTSLVEQRAAKRLKHDNHDDSPHNLLDSNACNTIGGSL